MADRIYPTRYSPVRTTYSPVRTSPVRVEPIRYSPTRVVYDAPPLQYSPVRTVIEAPAQYSPVRTMVCPPAPLCPPAPVCAPVPAPVCAPVPLCPPPVRVDERDLIIAELRQQLSVMRQQHHGDIAHATNEVCNAENRLRMLGDDKARHGVDATNVVNQQCGEITGNQHALNELRHCIVDKENANAALSADLNNARHVLGDKCLGAHKTREESEMKTVEVEQNRATLAALTNELEAVKADRLNMGREIARLNDCMAQRVADGERMRATLAGLNNDVAATSNRVQDLEKINVMKSNDLAAKQQALVQTQCELQRVRDGNARVQADVDGLVAANTAQANQNTDLKNELTALEARNCDLVINVGKADEKLKGLEAQLHCTVQDNVCAKKVNCELTNALNEKLAEKNALEGHVACLTNQNAELSKELSAFVAQDEQLRAQLDRRARVEVLEKKNANE